MLLASHHPELRMQKWIRIVGFIMMYHEIIMCLRDELHVLIVEQKE
jgi:hypothetical protein